MGWCRLDDVAPVGEAVGVALDVDRCRSLKGEEARCMEAVGWTTTGAVVRWAIR